jgi:PAS domain S-box-containing protein
MVLTDPRQPDNPIVYVNRAFEQLTGYASDVAVGRNCRFLQCDDTDPGEINALRSAIDAGEEVAVTLTNARANGDRFLNALLISPIVDETSGEIAYFVGLQREVRKNRQAERLKEFEDLVSELHHRVKNHLSMILSLVRMEARDQDSTGSENLTDLSRRIESLQLIYEEMSAARASSNEDKIQLGSYLGRIANAIAYLDGRAGVRMNIHVEPLVVDTEKAVRIGLIVSEILTNAMQHAFVDQRTGLVELRVTRTDDGGMRAIVSDDGVGLPAGENWPNVDGLGGRIVKGLCDGLGATLHVTRGAVGTVVLLDVPDAD